VEIQVSIFSFNKNKLINKRQQGSVLTLVRGELSQIVHRIDLDPMVLGR